MNKKNNLLIALMALCLTAMSCGDKTPVNIGGTGGTETITLLPQHHGLSKNIDTCKAYIKYNAVDQPMSFDDSVTCVCADTIVTCNFTGLKKGNYFVYGYGFDSSIQEHVKGGIPITITEQNTTTVIHLPVSED